MELQYEKLLAENNLEVSELSSEAKVLVEQLKGTLKGVNMLEKSGKTATEKTLEKIQALDNIICREINEQIGDSKDNDTEEEEEEEEEEQGEEEQEEEDDEEVENSGAKDDSEVDEEEEDEEEEIEETPTEIIAEPNDPKGFQIDKDLKVAHEGGKKTITLEELKTISKTAYDVIFNTYDESGDNGVVTSIYSLIETDENVFTLTKK